MQKRRDNMVYLHLGWMKFYEGPDGDDMMFGPHRWLGDGHEFGHECYTFKKNYGNYYGFVPSKANINIGNFGAGRRESSVRGITVVFFAKNPDTDIPYIVGWYKDAEIYRNLKPFPSEIRNMYGEHWYYSIVTNAHNGTCVPEDEREVEIPTNKKKQGGYGQSVIWYGTPAFNAKVKRYIDDYSKRTQTGRSNLQGTETERGSGGFNLDPDERAKIEKISVDLAKAYLRGMKYKWRSVESDGVGWDLTAWRGESQLFVEVKGTKGSVVGFELTPNEYRALRENTDIYRICAVTLCLEHKPKLHFFTVRHRLEDNVVIGRDEEGHEIELREAVAARCKAKW